MAGLSSVLVTPDVDELGGCGVAMGNGRLLRAECASCQSAAGRTDPALSRNLKPPPLGGGGSPDRFWRGVIVR